MRIKNWDEFQHFKDRTPPWIKLHRTLLERRDISVISDCSFRVLIGLWLLASEDKEMKGNLPSIEDMVFRLRIEKPKIIKALEELKSFIDDFDITAISEGYQDDRPEKRRGEAEGEIEGEESSANFVSWWEQYPAKKSKKKAEAIYLGIVKRKEATPELLLAGLLKYNASEEVERGYIKNPTTWLNQGCWEDEHQRKPQQRSELMEAIDRI